MIDTGVGALIGIIGTLVFQHFFGMDENRRPEQKKESKAEPEEEEKRTLADVETMYTCPIGQGIA